MKTFLPTAMLVIALIGLGPRVARAQICAGSTLKFVVRDAKGAVIESTWPAALKIEGKAGTYADQDWGKGSVSKERIEKAQRGKTQTGQVLALTTDGMCIFKKDMTLRLTWRGKIMSLLFKAPRIGEYASQPYIVDSLPFQVGTFEMDLTPTNRNSVYYPPSSWKKVAARP